MSDESECRHLPEPVYNPPRCPKCSALLCRSATTQGDARLLKDAMDLIDGQRLFRQHERADLKARLSAAIADAERANVQPEPVDARLLAAAKFFASWCPQFSERYGAEHDHHLDAIADAERAAAWTSDRPTAPGWYWVDFGHGVTVTEYNEHWIRHMETWGTGGGRFAGPIAPPPASGGGEG